MVNRVLQPADAGVLEGAAGGYGGGLVPAFGAVHHNVDGVADGRADGADAGGLGLGGAAGAEAQFDFIVAGGDVGGGRLLQFVNGHTVPEGVAGVGRHAVGGAAEQAVQRDAQDFAGGVPLGDVDGRHGHGGQAAGADPVGGAFHPAVGGVVIEDIQSGQQVAQLGGGGGHGAHQAAPVGDDPADAVDAGVRAGVRAGVGVQAGEEVPVAGDGVAGGGVGQGYRGFQYRDGYAGD